MEDIKINPSKREITNKIYKIYREKSLMNSKKYYILHKNERKEYYKKNRDIILEKAKNKRFKKLEDFEKKMVENIYKEFKPSDINSLIDLLNQMYITEKKNPKKLHISINEDFFKAISPTGVEQRKD